MCMVQCLDEAVIIIIHHERKEKTLKSLEWTLEGNVTSHVPGRQKAEIMWQTALRLTKQYLFFIVSLISSRRLGHGFVRQQLSEGVLESFFRVLYHPVIKLPSGSQQRIVSIYHNDSEAMYFKHHLIESKILKVQVQDFPMQVLICSILWHLKLIFLSQ